MTPKRPKALKWTGETYPDGRPAQFLDFVPPRDLTEDETDALDQDQLAIIRGSGLYREVAQTPEPKRKQKAAAAPEPEPSTDEPSGAETPASDGGDAAESES